MVLPPNLIEQVRQQRGIPFLGAGASFDARSPAGEQPPSGKKLAQILSQKFLGGEFDSAPLAQVSELAMSENSILGVQQYVRQIFEIFEPSDAHKKLTRFAWAGIATTNYDLLVEKAYASQPGALQIPIPFIENGEQIIEKLRDPKGVRFLKLHGCINRTLNDSCPLILSTDQYIRYKKGRSRLFDQLHEWAYEHTIIFIGHGGQDSNIREVLFSEELNVKNRPMYYAVLPNASDIEKRFWSQHRVTILDGGFSDFVSSLDSSLGDSFRSLITPTVGAHPVANRFRVAGATMSKNLIDFLQNDGIYIKSHNPKRPVLAKDFYRGYLGGWRAFEQELDVHRDFADDVTTDVILTSDLQKPKPLEVILIKGYAGSGKTVSLRRIAWDGSHEYDRLCIYANDMAQINIGAIQELIELCKERLFLFVDNAQERTHDLRRIINEIGEQGTLLTVILAARTNEWNLVASDVQASVSATYEVPNLNRGEIARLLNQLKKHNALGKLDNKSEEQKFHAFEGIAGRNLLVGLHEATMGDQFEAILENEYNKITPNEAQQVYLTICILNRLGVPVRAGLISRIHNIPFGEFQRRLFHPLEHVVYCSEDKRMRDMVYRARHVIIAEIVFDRVLRDADMRFEEYIRTFSSLNVDYSTDNEAFRQMIRGRVVTKLFTNHEQCEALFETAYDMVGEEPNLLQQRAIYQMHRPNGSLAQASQLLNRAISAQPYNKSFKHTLAELSLRMSEEARTPLEREKFLREASALAIQSKEGRLGDTHANHTLAKVNIKRLEAAFAEGNADFGTPNIQSIVRAVESEIAEGLQTKPGDSYLLTEQANLARLLKDSPKMVLSLQKAFTHSPRLGYLAIQLARCHIQAGKMDDARNVFTKALEANRNDKVLNYQYALFLSSNNGTQSEIAYHLKRSFTPGDQNYDAQLRYCRALYTSGEFESLRDELNKMKDYRNYPYIPDESLYYAPGVTQGRVNGVRHSHIFVTEQKSQISALIPRHQIQAESWPLMSVGSQVHFEVGFTFKGLSGRRCIVI